VVVAVEFQPAVNTLEGLWAGDVVDEDGAVGIADVVGDKTFELLLAGSVPKLQAVDSPIVVNVLDEKVNADSFLDARRGTALLESKRSRMKRSMMADLPTADCPRKTILYLTSHNLVLSSNILRWTIL
jgi:hypothetical protein